MVWYKTVIYTLYFFVKTIKFYDTVNDVIFQKGLIRSCNGLYDFIIMYLIIIQCYKNDQFNATLHQ